MTTTTQRRRAWAVPLMLLSVLVAVLTACGGPSATSAAPRPAGVPVVQGGDTATDTATVATATGPVEVYPAPQGGVPDQTVPATLATGTPRTFLVTATETGRVQVLLPSRPAGARGWVDRADVELSRTDLAVEVSLGDRHLTVVRGHDLVVHTPIAVGALATPTPTGVFYITDLLQPSDPNGAYGPYAFGLSAYSDVLTDFAGGDGQVGLHGTNDPASIGHPVTHGCLRVSNAVISQLAGLLGLGTPVVVHA